MPLKTIDNLCRICVQESHTFKHIYDQYILDIRLFEIINDLCQLNVYLGDGLPQYICPCCHSKLLEFHKFKQTSHEGKAALLSIKLKLEKMNSEAREMAAEEAANAALSQGSHEDDWGNRQLPVESIGQLLEVHIKEEPEDMNPEEPEDYSISSMRREGSSYHMEQVEVSRVKVEKGENEIDQEFYPQACNKLGSVAAMSAEGENTCSSDGEKSTVISGKFPNSGTTVKLRKKCRKCFVPYCKNTTSGNAEKGFVNVPLHRDRRIAWFKAARREISSMPSYELYCCGDHFNLQEDTENYMYHKTMGVSLRIKKDVLPHIFDCQPDRGEEEDVPLQSPASKDKGHSVFGEGIASSSAYNT